MKALCITGSDQETLNIIATPFREAGMLSAKPIQRETEIDFRVWHNKVYSAFLSAKPIGKVWENLAIDLLLANIEGDCWGWVEERSVHALNFWADLEPEIHFLLVTNRPDQELVKRLQKGDSIEKGSTLIEEWFARHKAMLDFYLTHPDRCIIVDEQDASRHLSDQLLIANQHWQLPLQTDQLEDQNDQDTSSKQEHSGNNVVQLLAKEVLKQSNLDLEGLHQEIQAAKYTFESNQDVQEQVDQFMSWLKADLSKEELHEILVDYQNLAKQASQAQRLLSLQDQQANEIKLIEQSQVTFKQEHELITLQLRQTQEELESSHLEKCNLESSILEKNNEINALKQELQAAIIQSNEQDNLKQENELITLQLQQTQEELETIHAEKRNLESSASEKDNEIHVLKQELQGLSFQLNEKDNLKQEKELLTLQLQQTQEELEQVFAKANQLEAELEQSHSEFDSAQLDSIKQEFEQSETQLKTQLQASQVAQQAAENNLEHLQQENELLTLQLQQTQEELEHYFAENQSAKQKNQELENSKSLLLSKINSLEAEQGKSKFKILLNKQPEPKIQYQSAILLNEQVNPDYEHLWIRLQSPNFEHQSAKAWNFRISCSNISDSSFGSHPKLELPEQNDQLLNQWFPESEDAEGKKLELRFALPKSMDKQVWRQINFEDQKLIKALVKQLPDILSELQATNQISRDWSEWLKLSQNMQKIIKVRAK